MAAFFTLTCAKSANVSPCTASAAGRTARTRRGWWRRGRGTAASPGRRAGPRRPEEPLGRRVGAGHQHDVGQPRQDRRPRGVDRLGPGRTRRVDAGDPGSPPARRPGEGRSGGIPRTAAAHGVRADDRAGLPPVRPGVGRRGTGRRHSVLPEGPSCLPRMCRPAPSTATSPPVTPSPPSAASSTSSEPSRSLRRAGCRRTRRPRTGFRGRPPPPCPPPDRRR